MVSHNNDHPLSQMTACIHIHITQPHFIGLYLDSPPQRLISISQYSWHVKIASHDLPSDLVTL